MDLFDILFMKKTRRIKNDADITDILLTNKISDDGLYPSNSLFPSDDIYPKDNKRRQ